ncbi:MAG: hypothetical protein CML16_16505 [Pusillimonas sp.]|nr:hypothetical protein [Pusillimonas sp.]MBC42139.1 hypothetical protein [Pusillimonas sp.]HCP77228.1 hypothetical protein [Pusillimonas sp.]
MPSNRAGICRPWSSPRLSVSCSTPGFRAQQRRHEMQHHHSADILAIHLVCKDLAVRSACLVDQQDYETLVQLFTPDATLVRPGGSPLVGREQILASYQSKPRERLTRHFITNSVVYEADVDSARMTSYVLLWSTTGDTPLEAFGRKADARQAAGQFDDIIVRTDEGWRIAQRSASFQMYRE